MRNAILRRILSSLATLALTGLAAATLLRLAPGFDVEVSELDGRTSAETLRQMREARAGEQDIVSFYGRYLRDALQGDLGRSRSYEVPVTGLIAERLPVTLKLIAWGLAGAWACALLLALANIAFPKVELGFNLLTAVMLSVPAGLVALLILMGQRPVALGLAIALFPKLFSYSRGLFKQNAATGYALAARARGLSAASFLSRYVVWPASPALLAILGLSVNAAFGGAILLETICDLPGVGQLALQAALARDLPLLVGMTLFVGALTVSANAVTDLASLYLTRGRGRA
ncbi:MAG: ABC transporter permease [Bryobacteraceae bacterium]|nr:ABC transporter permease [Bryobacteraceae bacterium]